MMTFTRRTVNYAAAMIMAVLAIWIASDASFLSSIILLLSEIARTLCTRISLHRKQQYQRSNTMTHHRQLISMNLINHHHQQHHHHYHHHKDQHYHHLPNKNVNTILPRMSSPSQKTSQYIVNSCPQLINVLA